MSNPESTITVIGEDNCPYYKVEDEFSLFGKALIPPPDKPACLILVGDITKVNQRFESNDTARYLFYCAGCTGLIKLEYVKEDKTGSALVDNSQAEDIGATARSLSNFSIFQTLDEYKIQNLVTFLKHQRFEKGDIIIKKGEAGKNLYVIASGKVEVLGDDGVRIAVLGKGEVFGEMSLLSGDPVGATIKVMEPATVLYLNGKYFRNVLNKFPSIQMYLSRLLVRRLAKSNIIWSKELASGIVGKLSEMPPAELFQTLNLNNKTGGLTIKLPHGVARAYFKDGDLIRVRYKNLEGRDAFFEILKEKEGRFKFIPGLPAKSILTDDVGDFMALLMEGLRRIDEENALMTQQNPPQSSS